jgi:hypothetical protein
MEPKERLAIARLREKLSSVECSYSDMLEMWKSCEKQNQELRALLDRARDFVKHCDECGAYRDVDSDKMLNEIDAALTKF